MPPESIFYGESSAMSDVLVVSFLSSVESIVTEYAKCVFLRTYPILLLGHTLLKRIVERNQTGSVLTKFNRLALVWLTYPVGPFVSCVNVERP